MLPDFGARVVDDFGNNEVVSNRKCSFGDFGVQDRKLLITHQSEVPLDEPD